MGPSDVDDGVAPDSSPPWRFGQSGSGEVRLARSKAIDIRSQDVAHPCLRRIRAKTRLEVGCSSAYLRCEKTTVLSKHTSLVDRRIGNLASKHEQREHEGLERGDASPASWTPEDLFQPLVEQVHECRLCAAAGLGGVCIEGGLYPSALVVGPVNHVRAVYQLVDARRSTRKGSQTSLTAPCQVEAPAGVDRARGRGGWGAAGFGGDRRGWR